MKNKIIYFLLIITLLGCVNTSNPPAGEELDSTDTEKIFVEQEYLINDIFHDKIVNIFDDLIMWNDTMNFCDERSKSKILVFHFLNSSDGKCRFRIGADNVYNQKLINGHTIYKGYLIAYYNHFPICNDELINIDLLDTSMVTGYPNETDQMAIDNYCEVLDNKYEIKDSLNMEIVETTNFWEIIGKRKY